jgi:hypothetical protein
MGQEISVTCPVCRKNNAVYRDIFKAECLDVETFEKYKDKYPPFEKYLGPNCLKYLPKRNSGMSYFGINNQMFPGLKDFDREINAPEWNKKEGYVSWIFYSCDECIFIDDIDRNEKFSEYNPSGIKVWRYDLP